PAGKGRSRRSSTADRRRRSAGAGGRARSRRQGSAPQGERGIEQVGGHPRVQAPGETAGPSFVKLAVSGETEHRGMRVMDGRHEILLVQLWNTTLKEG